MLTRPALLLKLEDACILIASLLLYQHLHFSWILFAILFLAPDLFMLGYLHSPHTGSTLYNLGHTLAVPLFLLLIASIIRHPLLTAISFIWIAHIAADRVLGYGLKYPAHFKDTHLQHLN